MKNEIELINPCIYSFNDLMKKSNKFYDLTNKSQDEINNIVKKLCNISGWYYKDITKDNIKYTSFSPEYKLN